MPDSAMWSIFIVVVYFVPTIHAFSNHHRSRSGIAALNFFLGWTLIGWVIALAWSGSGAKDDPESPSFRTHIKCPDCAELILKEARVCKHCGCKLLPQP